MSGLDFECSPAGQGSGCSSPTNTQACLGICRGGRGQTLESKQVDLGSDDLILNDCSFIHSLTDSLARFFIHSFIHLSKLS